MRTLKTVREHGPVAIRWRELPSQNLGMAVQKLQKSHGPCASNSERAAAGPVTLTTRGLQVPVDQLLLTLSSWNTRGGHSSACRRTYSQIWSSEKVETTSRT